MLLHNESVATRDPLGVRPYSRDKIANTIPGSNSVVYPSTNWQETLLKDYTFNQRAHLNISGGGKVAQYYVAGSFTQDQGMLKVAGNNKDRKRKRLNTSR